MYIPEWLIEFIKDESQEDKERHLLSYFSILDDLNLLCPISELSPDVNLYGNNTYEVNRYFAKDYRHKDFGSLSESLGKTVTFKVLK